MGARRTAEGVYKMKSLPCHAVMSKARIPVYNTVSEEVQDQAHLGLMSPVWDSVSSNVWIPMMDHVYNQTDEAQDGIP